MNIFGQLCSDILNFQVMNRLIQNMTQMTLNLSPDMSNGLDNRTESDHCSALKVQISSNFCHFLRLKIRKKGGYSGPDKFVPTFWKKFYQWWMQSAYPE